MCAISAYVGPEQAEPVMMAALQRQRHLGDHANGLAVLEQGEIRVQRADGELKHLAELVGRQPISGHCGIAHTRDATIGGRTLANCHPHLSADRGIAVVHSGTIRNHRALRLQLEAEGERFVSETDSEVIPHLLAREFSSGKTREDALAALRSTVSRLEGTFAIVAIFAILPDALFAARKGTPLFIALGKARPDPAGGRVPHEVLMASDVAALMPRAWRIRALRHGEIACADASGIVVSTFAGEPVPTTFGNRWIAFGVEILRGLVRATRRRWNSWRERRT